MSASDNSCLFIILFIFNNPHMEGDKLELQPISLHPKAYRFFPRREQQKSAFEKKGSRFFFYGQVEHDEYEVRKLREFHEYVVKKEKEYNKMVYNSDHLILQLLSANKYKPKETLKAMKEHEQFKTKYAPSINYQKIEPVLKTGFYYICGRDLCFRPILVYKIKLVDKKDFEQFYDASAYLQEEIIKKMLLPGQVESWSIIYDFQSMSLSDLPLTSMKSIVERLSLNYGGRLHKLWVVNAPSGISTTWKIVSTFLDDVTVDKIKISKTNSEASMFQMIDRSQIEVKYGGTQPNRTQLHPLAIPPAFFDQKRLCSDQEYEQLLKSGKLSRNIIDPLFNSAKQ